MEYKSLLKQIDASKIPVHVGVIMDGNGRWAKQRGGIRLDGHKKGTDAVRRIVEASAEIGLKHLTIYAFSTENWTRPKLEVAGLLKLILNSLLDEVETLHKNNVNMKFIGTNEKMNPKYWERIHKTCEKTWNNTGLNLNVAMNYGGRLEIIEAIQEIQRKIQNNELEDQKITEELISAHLYTKDIPDPDLIIRTSGEQRLSNFLLWQSAYSEFWFTKTLWPDFSKIEFIQAILDFQNRERRFGAV
jgi:undecaprenyl diphosphate synthase